MPFCSRIILFVKSNSLYIYSIMENYLDCNMFYFIIDKTESKQKITILRLLYCRLEVLLFSNLVGSTFVHIFVGSH